MPKVRAIASNLLSVVIGLLLLVILLELGLRAVYFSADPRVLVYPPVASDINGLRDSDFDSEIPPGEFRILALGASAFVTRDFQPKIQGRVSCSPTFNRGWAQKSKPQLKIKGPSTEPRA